MSFRQKLVGLGISTEAYLRSEFSTFERDDLFQISSWRRALKIFSWWAIPAMFFVLGVENYASDVEFFNDAMREGIGPNLWNLMGALGLVVFALAIVFPNMSTLASYANQVFESTFAVGCLTLGLLIGQYVFLVAQEGMVWWERGLFGVFGGWLLLLVFTLNCVIWFLSSLTKQQDKVKNRFLVKVEKKHWLWRSTISLFLLAVTFSMLYLET